jgi:hypothetical protein
MIFGFIGTVRRKSNRFDIYKVCLCFFFSSLLPFLPFSRFFGWLAFCSFFLYFSV